MKILPLSKYPQLIDKAALFLSESFSTFEPVCLESAVQIKYLNKITYSLLANSMNYSSICIDKDKQLIGASLSDDLANIQEDQFEIPELTKPLHLLFLKLDSIYLERHKISLETIKKNTYFNQIMCSRNRNIKGQNLGSALFAHNLQLAKNNGFKYSKIECTNKGSKHVGASIGFQTYCQLDYQKLTVDDSKQTYWKDIPAKYGEQTLDLMELKIEKFDFKSFCLRNPQFQFEF